MLKLKVSTRRVAIFGRTVLVGKVLMKAMTSQLTIMLMGHMITCVLLGPTRFHCIMRCIIIFNIYSILFSLVSRILVSLSSSRLASFLIYPETTCLFAKEELQTPCAIYMENFSWWAFVLSSGCWLIMVEIWVFFEPYNIITHDPQIWNNRTSFSIFDLTSSSLFGTSIGPGLAYFISLY